MTLACLESHTIHLLASVCVCVCFFFGGGGGAGKRTRQMYFFLLLKDYLENQWNMTAGRKCPSLLWNFLDQQLINRNKHYIYERILSCVSSYPHFHGPSTDMLSSSFNYLFIYLNIVDNFKFSKMIIWSKRVLPQDKKKPANVHALLAILTAAMLYVKFCNTMWMA